MQIGPKKIPVAAESICHVVQSELTSAALNGLALISRATGVWQRAFANLWNVLTMINDVLKPWVRKLLRGGLHQPASSA